MHDLFLGILVLSIMKTSVWNVHFVWGCFGSVLGHYNMHSRVMLIEVSQPMSGVCFLLSVYGLGCKSLGDIVGRRIPTCGSPRI